MSKCTIPDSTKSNKYILEWEFDLISYRVNRSYVGIVCCELVTLNGGFMVTYAHPYVQITLHPISHPSTHAQVKGGNDDDAVARRLLSQG